MAQPVKTVTTKITMRNLTKIPAVILEQHNIGKGDSVSVTYGKNWTVMIVMPLDTKLSANMQERISLLVNEKLD